MNDSLSELMVYSLYCMYNFCQSESLGQGSFTRIFKGSKIDIRDGERHVTDVLLKELDANHKNCWEVRKTDHVHFRSQIECDTVAASEWIRTVISPFMALVHIYQKVFLFKPRCWVFFWMLWVLLVLINNKRTILISYFTLIDMYWVKWSDQL